MAYANPARLIAQQVVDLINDVPDDRVAIPKTDWTADRAYVAYYKGEDLKDLTVRVYPDGQGSDGDEDRESEIMTYSVSVVVAKNVSTDLSEQDALIDLVHNLQSWIVRRENREFDNRTSEPNVDLQICAELAMPLEIDPIVDQKALHEHKQFFSRTFFNYEVHLDRRA